MPKIGEIVNGKKLGYRSTNRRIWLACIKCGKERWVILRKGKPDSLRCHHCAQEGKNQGSNNPRWKNGRHKDSQGYVYILVNLTSPYASMRNNHNYIFEHRLVMAKHLGRCLKTWELVHHINHIRDDNRVENLKLHEISDHQAITILETENRKLKKEIYKLKKQLR